MQDPSGKGLVGVVAVTGQREDLSLRVVAPIMPLPKGQAALLKALRRIAEMNYEIPGHSRLAIDSRTIWAVVAHDVGDIGPDDVPNCIFDCVWLAQAGAEWLKGPKPKNGHEEALGGGRRLRSRYPRRRGRGRWCRPRGRRCTRRPLAATAALAST